MAMPDTSHPADGSFVATRWSLVARSGGDSPSANAALTWLCEAYWEPLYRFARRRGLNHHDAQDATQGFFARLIERRVASEADPAKGRFRSFIVKAFACHLSHERERAQALKRGGGTARVAVDEEPQPVTIAPDPDFDRDWATALLGRALARLERDYAGRRAALFARLRGFLSGDGTAEAYAAAGAGLGLSEGAVKVAVHRLRARFRALLREEVAETVADPERPGAVDEELADLLAVLGRPGL